jgi:hypothetical protein
VAFERSFPERVQHAGRDVALNVIAIGTAQDDPSGFIKGFERAVTGVEAAPEWTDARIALPFPNRREGALRATVVHLNNTSVRHVSNCRAAS